MSKKNPTQKSEITRKFDEIFEEHHSPEAREKKKLEENRKRKAEIKKQDYGL